MQIFEVLRKIGRNHVFSAGLVIGGKSLKEEAERLARINILVCTPGRMLQHLDQTAGFDANNLQILVLDEADRIMDMGFQSAVDALVDHLPKTRQTLMFSATQSKKVSDLARLSLHEPEYVSVHEAAASATPTNLQQNYVTMALPDKLDTLWGFIKSNLKSKMIVFLSSGKQVRFVYESFRHLQPGIPLLHLHGRQKQGARLKITSQFAAAKHSCLIATDVVARGIDFPAVDWVIQADCPEDADTYIHRVGRTARYQSNGRAVLFLDPSEEEGMIKQLEQRKIPIKPIRVRENRKKSIKDDLQNLCFQKPDLKYLGQKAFISYTRAIHLRKHKDVFKLSELDLDAFAASLGLPGTPQIKFCKGSDIKKIKNAPRDGMSSGSESEMDPDDAGESKKKEKKNKKSDKVRTKYDKMFERQNQDVLSEHYSKLVADDGGDGNGAQADESDNDDDDNDILAVKRRLDDADIDAVIQGGQGHIRDAKVIGGLGGAEPFVIDSKRREKALLSKKKMLKYKGQPTKLVFDEDGQAHELYELQHEEDFKRQGPAEDLRQQFVESEAARVREADVHDKQHAREKRRLKKEKRKASERAGAAAMAGYASDDDDDGAQPTLAVGGGQDGDEDEDPLALLRSLPVPGAAKDESDQEPPRKKKKKDKKWFQDDDDVDEQRPSARSTRAAAPKSKVFHVADEPETLEDLEALATGLLGD